MVDTSQPDFRGIEGYEDHAVEVLFFFDNQEKLLAAAINIACTAQEVEGRSTVNADFFTKSANPCGASTAAI